MIQVPNIIPVRQECVVWGMSWMMVHNAKKNRYWVMVVSRPTSLQPLPIYPPVDAQRYERFQEKRVVVEDVGQKGVGWPDWRGLIASPICCDTCGACPELERVKIASIKGQGRE